MTIEKEKFQEGRNAFNNLAGFCHQDPCDLSPYSNDKKSDHYISWMKGWLGAGADFWENMIRSN